MKKLGTYLLYGIALAFVVALAYFSFKTDKKPDVSEKMNNVSLTEEKTKKSAEKIQVFLFHSTQRCITCITIGKYAKATVEQKFPEELKAGKIEFREINIDLPENKELTDKFKATGSSLYINSIIDGKDNIQPDIQVWRLTYDEQKFISYLSDKINSLL